MNYETCSLGIFHSVLQEWSAGSFLLIRTARKAVIHFFFVFFFIFSNSLDWCMPPDINWRAHLPSILPISPRAFQLLSLDFNDLAYKAVLDFYFFTIRTVINGPRMRYFSTPREPETEWETDKPLRCALSAPPTIPENPIWRTNFILGYQKASEKISFYLCTCSFER